MSQAAPDKLKRCERAEGPGAVSIERRGEGV